MEIVALVMNLRLQLFKLELKLCCSVSGPWLRKAVRGGAAAGRPLQAPRELHAQGRQAPLPPLQRGFRFKVFYHRSHLHRT